MRIRGFGSTGYRGAFSSTGFSLLGWVLPSRCWREIEMHTRRRPLAAGSIECHRLKPVLLSDDAVVARFYFIAASISP